MDMFFALQLAQTAGELLNLLGVLVIVVGVVASSIYAGMELLDKKAYSIVYKSFRRYLGRCILLGLEFLVAGDIIRSVTGEPSFTSVAVLAIVVLIRTFLSITFEMEVEGRWPWQKGPSK